MWAVVFVDSHPARLTNFHFLARASPLGRHLDRLVVATSEHTQLPTQWRWADAEHRVYKEDEVEKWREVARKLGGEGRGCGGRFCMQHCMPTRRQLFEGISGSSDHLQHHA